jgi:hypothetical protein
VFPTGGNATKNSTFPPCNATVSISQEPTALTSTTVTPINKSAAKEGNKSTASKGGKAATVVALGALAMDFVFLLEGHKIDGGGWRT